MGLGDSNPGPPVGGMLTNQCLQGCDDARQACAPLVQQKHPEFGAGMLHPPFFDLGDSNPGPPVGGTLNNQCLKGLDGVGVPCAPLIRFDTLDSMQACFNTPQRPWALGTQILAHLEGQ